ncbi:MAG: class I SAM-dependent methyltransferase [Actinomycetota bacterium]
MNVEEFVAAHLPQPPVRVLEIGCGTGELARALATRGYTVTAIDPNAPEGAIFRRASLEDFSTEQRFDAVIASRSLHHIPDLAAGLRKIHSLLDQGGMLILNEFAWDQMDEKTARWYRAQVPKPGPEDESLLHGTFSGAWVAEHEGLHDSKTMRRALEVLFQAQLFEWVPYIAEYHAKRHDLIDEESRLIRTGDINPLGFRYVGICQP